MGKNRLEAFSDGVLAIVITIMVLGLRAPMSAASSELIELIPALMSYLLSFVYVGIYWSNHHHLLQSVQTVDGRVLWANLHLLFWLSLIPFATAWLGENYTSTAPVAVYGFTLLMSAAAYFVLAHVLVKHQGKGTTLEKALGKDSKGKLSLVLYGVGIVLTFIEPAVSLGIYVAVAGIWFLPDRRIEQQLIKG